MLPLTWFRVTSNSPFFVEQWPVVLCVFRVFGERYRSWPCDQLFRLRGLFRLFFDYTEIGEVLAVLVGLCGINQTTQEKLTFSRCPGRFHSCCFIWHNDRRKDFPILTHSRHANHWISPCYSSGSTHQKINAAVINAYSINWHKFSFALLIPSSAVSKILNLKNSACNW